MLKPKKFNLTLAMLVYLVGAVSALASDQVKDIDMSQLRGSSDDGFSFNVGVTSDYRFRGISQTRRNPAVSGGVDWTNGKFYAGVWASSIDFGGSEGPAEVDLYLGLNHQVDGVDFQFGGIYYLYPGADDAGGEFNYYEINASVEGEYGLGNGKFAVNYSPDYFGESGNAFYSELSLSKELLESIEISGGLGYQAIENNAAFGANDYITWNAGASFTIGAFTLDARYIDTNLDLAECFNHSELCGATGVVSLTADF